MKNSNKVLIIAMNLLALFCHLKASRQVVRIEPSEQVLGTPHLLSGVIQFLSERDRQSIARVSRALSVVEGAVPIIINVTDNILTNTTRLASLQGFLGRHTNVRIDFPITTHVTDTQLRQILQHQIQIGQGRVTGQNVKRLNLCNCIRLRDFNLINNCPLIELFLSMAKINNNQLRQILQNQPYLNVFSLEFCPFLQTFNLLNYCPRLQKACFNSCALQVININGHANLQTLKVKKCKNVRTVNLINCSSLVEFCLSRNERLREIDLRGCSVLQKLSFSRTNINDGLLKQIVQQVRQHLTELKLRKCQNLNHVEITDCSHLRKLNFSKCRYLARINLSGCANLQVLDLSFTNVTDELLRSILDQVESLRAIRILGLDIAQATLDMIRERKIEIRYVL